MARRHQRPYAMEAAERFAAVLRDQYVPGQRISATRLIRDTCDVSDSTAYEAVKILERQGLLEVHHGLASTVLEPPALDPIERTVAALNDVRAAFEQLGRALDTLQALHRPTITTLGTRTGSDRGITPANAGDKEFVTHPEEL